MMKIILQPSHNYRESFIDNFINNRYLPCAVLHANRNLFNRILIASTWDMLCVPSLFVFHSFSKSRTITVVNVSKRFNSRFAR